MKFVAYVVLILLCESYKFGEKISYSNQDNKFFLRDCFLLVHPVYYLYMHHACHGFMVTLWSFTIFLINKQTNNRMHFNMQKKTLEPVDLFLD